MTFAVLGASGRTGVMAVSYCLRAGHNVRGLVRNPARAMQTPEGGTGVFEAVRGDVTEREAVRDVIRGTDAVISALGPTELRTGFRVHSSAARHLSELMPEEGISRYVAVSGASLSVPTDKFSVRGKFFSGAAWLLTKTNRSLKNLLDDKRAEYEILCESGLDWTVVRPPWITPEPYMRDANITPFRPGGIRVRVAELGKALVDLAVDGRFSKQAVFINSV